jgi:ResB-like family
MNAPLTPSKYLMRSLPTRLFAFLSSFGLGVVVLSFLLLLTWLGTIRQVNMSLLDVQRKYFDSIVLFEELGPFKIPLPGATLLMGILFVNMVCGGIIRIRKNWRTFGVVIAHLSILTLLVAGLVSMLYKVEGHLRLFEGQSGDVFTSFHDRVIEIAEVGKDSPVLMLREKDFHHCVGTTSRTFVAEGLPFELRLSGYTKNADAEEVAMRPPPPQADVIDGFYLAARPEAKEAEGNLAGCVAIVKMSSGTEKKVLLWEAALAPVTVHTPDQRVFTLKLTRESWQLPYTITLNNFHHEYFPGTSKPKVYESNIVQRKNGIDQTVKIEMNKPLRDGGFTLFQTSFNDRWTPDRPRSEMYSVFTVVHNPSDKWPQWATIMAAVGIGIHFSMKLFASINRSAKRTRGVAFQATRPSTSTS